MRLTAKRGFTLIELLVVVAIIGTLSGVVVPSLNSARLKGTDSSIKSNMDNIRKQSAIFYEANDGSYNLHPTWQNSCAGSSCLNASSFTWMFLGDPVVQKQIREIVTRNKAGLTESNKFLMFNTDTGFSMAAELGTSGTYWCIDSEGTSRGVSLSGVPYNGTVPTGPTGPSNWALDGTTCR